MDVLTEKEVKLLVKYQLDEGAIFLLRLSYCIALIIFFRQ